MKMRMIIASVAMAGLTGSVALAQEIQPTSAVATSFYSPDNRSPTTTINGSGLTANATPTTLDDPHTNQPNSAMWLNNNDSQTPTITWTLDQNYDLTGFHLWNYNEIAGAQAYTLRGVATADVLVSSTDTGENFVLVNDDQAFAQASGLNTYTGEDYALAASNVRRVRFNVIDNFPGNPDNYTGLSEIRFVGTPVPEPATAGLLLVGGLGLALRRRRR